MKRDLELIRLLLLWINDNCDGVHTYSARQIRLDGHSLAEINFNLRLMTDASLITLDPSPRANPNAKIIQFSRLTNDGFDFLESIRETSVWNKVKSKVEELGSSCTLAVIKELAIHILESTAKP